MPGVSGLTVFVLAAPLVLAAINRARAAKAKKAMNGNGTNGLPPVGGTQPAGYTPKGGVIASLPDGAGKSYLQRDQMVLDAMRAGLEDQIVWQYITSVGDGPLEGYSLDVPVMTDALMIEGVRLTTGYRTAQYIADILTDRDPEPGPVLMMTPYIDALTFEQSHVPLTMTTSQQLSNKGVTTLTSQMIEVSKAVDAKLQKAIANKQLVPFYIVGYNTKNWVLTIKFTWEGVHHESKVPHKEAAANQGFYPMGQPWNAIQYDGVAHGLTHVDYSQALRFMGPESLLNMPDGNKMFVSTESILTDPNLGPLLSGTKGKLKGKQVGEGYLPFSRHPMIPKGVAA